RMEPAEMVRVPGAPVPTVLLRADRYFDRDGLYGEGGQDYPDNAERFAFFCRAALEWLRAEREPPDVLHVHEWQAALAPAFLRAAALRGILNGIDAAVWDPATDPHLPARYRAGDLAGKARCKRALQAELGLAVRDDAPLLGVVSRLAEQKGFDLLAVALPRVLEPADAQLAVLGSGEERYERWLREPGAHF